MFRPASPLHHHHHHEDHEGHDHGPAVTQDEANAIASNLDLGRTVYLQVHWVAGYRGGEQPLIQPIYAEPGDYFDN